MQKIDFKKQLPEIYNPKNIEFATINIPKMKFLKIDGKGNPNDSDEYQKTVEWLYSISYGIKFECKKKLEIDYVVPPLEGIWWSENMDDFVTRNKENWQWTMMLMLPDFISDDLCEFGLNKAKAKLGIPPSNLRFEVFEEGLCLQALHIGSYDDETPKLHKLHHEIMPAADLDFNGHHHEIYLSDPRKTAPEKLKTILRQPVKPK